MGTGDRRENLDPHPLFVSLLRSTRSATCGYDECMVRRGRSYYRPFGFYLYHIFRGSSNPAMLAAAFAIIGV